MFQQFNLNSTGIINEVESNLPNNFRLEYNGWSIWMTTVAEGNIRAGSALLLS